MYKSKVLELIIVATFVLFCASEFIGYELLSKYSWASIVPLFTLLYFVNIKDKKNFFSLFLVCYAISDIFGLFEKYISYFVFYVIANMLYVLAYSFLFLEICKSLSLLYVIKHFKIHLIVLVVLNVYIVCVLQAVIDPNVAGSYGVTYEYYLEMLYNIVMLLLLSVALMNYFYRDNKKSLFLFIGSLSIVFSEVINVAYLYITETKMLNFISSALAFLAFFLYYKQSKLENEKASRIVTQ